MNTTTCTCQSAHLLAAAHTEIDDLHELLRVKEALLSVIVSMASSGLPDET